jgi:hypothetical protein
MAITPYQIQVHNMTDEERFYLDTQTVDEVMNVIEFNGIDKDGLHWLDWFKRIERGDAFYNITLILIKNRKDQKYAELIEQLEAEIEGWL